MIRSKGTYFRKLIVSTNIDSRNTIYSRNSGYLSKQFVRTLKITSDISFVEIGKTYIVLSHC